MSRYDDTPLNTLWFCLSLSLSYFSMLQELFDALSEFWNQFYGCTRFEALVRAAELIEFAEDDLLSEAEWFPVNQSAREIVAPNEARSANYD